MKRSAVKSLCFAVLAAGALFALSANAALPTGYTQYTYIQGNATVSGGSTTAENAGYVITDIYLDPSRDTIDAVFQIGAEQSRKTMWCARGTGDTPSALSLLYNHSSNQRGFLFQYNALTPDNCRSSNTYDPGETITISVTGNNCQLTKTNGASETITVTGQSSFNSTGGPLMLFALGTYANSTYSRSEGWYNNSKLYSFTITRGGAVIHDLVPVVRDLDPRKGLYDVVADKFYAGTGSFTMGDEVVPLTDRLEITSSPGDVGSPSPSYGVTNGLAAADTFTVSCGATPAADSAGTTQYSCTGWKLYDATNAVVSAGAGTSFTYVHPTPAKYRRLEWQWEVTAYQGTIAAGHGGAVSQSSTGWFAADTPVTVTATPNAGNGFQRWTGTLPEGVSATSASVTFTPTAPFSMTAVFETVGSGGLVFFNEKTSSYWHTATNCVIDLPIEFPAGASSATLSVTGIDYSAQYAIPSGTAQYTLSLPAATSSTAENVYDLALAFNDSASTVRTAKLGLIYGHDATTTGWTRCLAPAGTRAWSKTKGVAVIPIPYGTTSFTIALDGGEATSTDTGLDGAAGWYPLRLKGEMTADLAATTLEGSLSASLRGDGAGFFLIVR